MNLGTYDDIKMRDFLGQIEAPRLMFNSPNTVRRKSP